LSARASCNSPSRRLLPESAALRISWRRLRASVRSSRRSRMAAVRNHSARAVNAAVMEAVMLT
jgi:hypothetical protein